MVYLKQALKKPYNQHMLTQINFVYVQFQGQNYYLTMRITQADSPIRFRSRQSPFQRSTSVAAVLQGSSPPDNRYYIDSLERFRRDHASIDRLDRQNQRQKMQKSLSQKILLRTEHQQKMKQNEQRNFQRLIDMQSQSLYLHKLGSKQTVHGLSQPINPITLNYQETERAKDYQRKEEQRRINGLVRSHHLQTYGSSGYNIINGQRGFNVEQLVNLNQLPELHSKLGQFYDRFRIKPEDIP